MIQFFNKYFRIPRQSELGTNKQENSHDLHRLWMSRNLYQRETENIVFHYSTLCYICIKQREKKRETELFETTSGDHNHSWNNFFGFFFFSGGPQVLWKNSRVSIMDLNISCQQAGLVVWLSHSLNVLKHPWKDFNFLLAQTNFILNFSYTVEKF